MAKKSSKVTKFTLLGRMQCKCKSATKRKTYTIVENCECKTDNPYNRNVKAESIFIDK